MKHLRTTHIYEETLIVGNIDRRMVNEELNSINMYITLYM